MRHKGRDRTSAIAHFGLDWQRCLATTSTASQNESVRVPFWSASIVETSLSHLKSVSSALGRYLQKHQAPRVVERVSSDVSAKSSLSTDLVFVAFSRPDGVPQFRGFRARLEQNRPSHRSIETAGCRCRV